MRLSEAFRSLRSRDFRVFFVAQTISQIATWMHSVAQVHRGDRLGRLPNVAPAALVRRAAGTGHESLHADPRRLLPDRRPADRRRLDRRRSTLVSAIALKASSQ